MRPPLKLQPERTDLVERGVTFSSLSCGGQAARNGSLVQLGEQYCCGLTHASVVHCWGKPPPHNGFRMPREDINPSGTRAPPGGPSSLKHTHSAPFRALLAASHHLCILLFLSRRRRVCLPLCVW